MQRSTRTAPGTVKDARLGVRPMLQLQRAARRLSLFVTFVQKYFDMSIHYFRDQVFYGYIVPLHVYTHLQRADGYTKCLDKQKHLTWCDTQLV